jgi:hypothetical protein
MNDFAAHGIAPRCIFLFLSKIGNSPVKVCYYV